MRFALVGNERLEAKPELKGALCPCCLNPVTAKCGEQRIHHWAHKSKRTCDSWWEPETEWHRAWKSKFPAEWQEFIRSDDQTGEKHIADVCTGHGLVLEFQHSAIKSEERISREQFYKNMVWVVDGDRLKRDYPRFLKEAETFRYINGTGFYLVPFPDECFSTTWLESSVPVVFDFLGDTPVISPQDDMRELLWCLLPGRAGRYAVLAHIMRNEFLARTLNHPQLFQEPANRIVDILAKLIQQEQAQRAAILLQRANRGVFTRVTIKRSVGRKNQQSYGRGTRRF